jgi:hypothetical protein
LTVFRLWRGKLVSVLLPLGDGFRLFRGLGFLSKLQPTLGHFQYARAILTKRHALGDVDAGRCLASEVS